MIPLELRLQVKKKNSRGIKLWLPFVLILLLMTVFLIVLFPLVLLAAIFTWNRGWGRALLMFYPHFFLLMFSLSGLKVDVETGNEKIDLDFV